MKRIPIGKPGAVIREELWARDMTQQQLADAMGRPLKAVNGIIVGAKRITEQTAVELSSVLGASPMFWLTLEANYRLALLQEREADDDGR